MMGEINMYNTIDGICFKNMLTGAYQLFQQKYEIINQLNVFPVPDGDTGNNMLNTLKSMYSMIAEEKAEQPVGILAERRQPAPSWGPEEIPVLSCPRSSTASAGGSMERKRRLAAR